MDTLFVGDIPTEYHYGVYNNGYIDLYNQQTLHQNTYTYYRVFLNNGNFTYRTGTTTVGQQYQYLDNINTSDKIVYRQDFFNIVFLTFLFTLIGIWFLNIITSVIRKGGVLGGLL